MFKQPQTPQGKFKSQFNNGGRTQEMLESAEVLGRRDIENGYVEYDGKQYPIATRLTEKFYKTDLASVGGGINNREIILVDKNELDTIYEELKRRLKLKNLFIKDNNKDIHAVTKVLTDVHKFIANKFKSNTNETVRPVPTEESQRYVHLSDYIKSNKILCRHYGLLNCFLLDYLIQEKILPPGRVCYFREKLTGKSSQGVPHLWTLYLPEGYLHNNKSQVIFNVDSSLNNIVLIDADSILHLQNTYGEATVQEIYNRYAPSTAVPKTGSLPPTLSLPDSSCFEPDVASANAATTPEVVSSDDSAALTPQLG